MTQDLPGISHARMTLSALNGGAAWIQLRIKKGSRREILSIAEEVRDLCRSRNAVFIINDHVQIAFDLGADGVHLGLSDMPLEKARAMLGPKKIIGGTANTKEEVSVHIKNHADYVGIGPFQHTETKNKLAPLLGESGIRDLARHFTGFPLIAIGGISLTDCDLLGKTGIYGMAVSSAVNKSANPELTVKLFIENLIHFKR